MPLFGPTRVEEGSKCTECRRGTYKKVGERHHGGGLAKAMFTGFMTGATKQSASELGLAKAVFKCSHCGHEVTN